MSSACCGDAVYDRWRPGSWVSRRLRQLGALDFAFGTVVHQIRRLGAMAALVLATGRGSAGSMDPPQSHYGAGGGCSGSVVGFTR